MANYSRNTANIGLAFSLPAILLSTLTACSAPTKPITEERILEVLAHIAPIPSPPATASNQDSAGWQVANHTCEWAAEFLGGYKQNFDELASDPDVRHSRNDDQHVWTFTGHLYQMELTVTAREKLYFKLQFLSGDLQDYWYEGWHSKSGKAGSITWHRVEYPIWTYEWSQSDAVQTHRREEHPMPNTSLWDDIIEVTGFQDGSGHVIWRTEDLFGPDIFEATWDAIGHGTSTAGNW
jgi:hypothetical protein